MFWRQSLKFKPLHESKSKNLSNCRKFIRKTYENLENSYVGHFHKDRQVSKKTEFRINEISSVCLDVSLSQCDLLSNVQHPWALEGTHKYVIMT